MPFKLNRAVCLLFAVTDLMGSSAHSQSPTDNAAAPTQDAANVASIFSDSYTDIATNYNPFWGQSGTVDAAFDPGTGNVVIHYSNFNYQGTDLPATNLSEWAICTWTCGWKPERTAS